MILTPVMKTCGGCGMTQPLDEVHFRPRKLKTGRTNWICRYCGRASSKRAVAKIRANPERRRDFIAKRTAAERQRLQDPEKKEAAREANRRYYQRLKEDPKRWEEMVVAKRIARRAKILDGGREPQAQIAGVEPYKPPSFKDSVSAKPFRDWLKREFSGMGVGEIAHETGYPIPTRRLWAVLSGEQLTVALATVDAFFTKGMDRPELLDRLYPYEEAIDLT